MKKIGVILVGVIFVAVGIFMLVNGMGQKQRCTEATVGIVVDVKTEESIDSDTGSYTYTYYPVIEYKVGDKTIEKQSSNGAGSSKYRINDRIQVLYNPDNIEEFIIKGEENSYLFSIAFIALGALVTVIGIVKKF